MSIKTKAQLATEANTNINTNGNNAITGAIHNTMLNNTFDSLCSIVDAETWNGVKTFGSFPITPSAAPTTDYQVSNKKYVDDKIGETIYKATLSLTNTQVNALGTSPQAIIAAQGTEVVTVPISIYMSMSVGTGLEVGAQNLVFTHSTGDLIAYVDNTVYESATGTVYWMPYIQGSKNVYDLVPNSSFYVGLSGGADGTGSAEMQIVVYYTKHQFNWI